ncbi:hypothetical protein BROUX41_005914 [Berkeleyomyces rouxiae]|uniref:uncharacterized protein n=1 Tax=Berkeleyomyces rouxiae TaxID=2035830 RepID=UPI003B7CC47E
MDVTMVDATDPALAVASSLAPEAEALAAGAVVVEAEPHGHHHHTPNHSHSHTPQPQQQQQQQTPQQQQQPPKNDLQSPHISELQATVTPSRERNALTLNQRRALRRWANSQLTRPSHRACQEWFEQEYGQCISQSTVSHSLSPKYSRLDLDAPQLSGSRMRFGNWPDVEKLVLKWYQQMLLSGRHPTNDELAEKSKAIFSALPQYKQESTPEFSPGWIHRFKKRYGLLIRRQRRHGDVENPAEDVLYLCECLQRFNTGPIGPNTSPAALRETIIRLVGVEPSVNVAALVRDEIVRNSSSLSMNAGNTSVMSIAAAAAASMTTPQATLLQAEIQSQPQPQSQGQPQAPPAQPQPQAQPQAQSQAQAQAQDPHQQPRPTQQQQTQPPQHQHQHHTTVDAGITAPTTVSADTTGSAPSPDLHIYTDDDAEMVLHTALRQLQQEEAAAEATAAAVREERDRIDHLRQSVLATPSRIPHHAQHTHAQQTPTNPSTVSTSSHTTAVSHAPSQTQTPAASQTIPSSTVAAGTSTPAVPTPAHGHARFIAEDDLTLTPIESSVAIPVRDKPVRCPFCVNQRMLRTIKEAVEHLSTHVEV